MRGTGVELREDNSYTLPCGHAGRVVVLRENRNIVVRSMPSRLRDRRREPFAFIVSRKETEDYDVVDDTFRNVSSVRG